MSRDSGDERRRATTTSTTTKTKERATDNFSVGDLLTSTYNFYVFERARVQDSRHIFILTIYKICISQALSHTHSALRWWGCGLCAWCASASAMGEKNDSNSIFIIMEWARKWQWLDVNVLVCLPGAHQCRKCDKRHGIKCILYICDMHTNACMSTRSTYIEWTKTAMMLIIVKTRQRQCASQSSSHVNEAKRRRRRLRSHRRWRRQRR